jgi:hypothetical protein
MSDRLLGRKALWFAGVWFAACAVAQVNTSAGGCLFSETPSAFQSPMEGDDCSDVLMVMRNEDVLSIARFLEIDPSELEFKGCAAAPFSTQPPAFRYAGARYTIRYPAEATSAQEILGPIAHELGHVQQMKMVGGYNRLIEKWPSINRELGADFLAGLSLRAALPKQRTRAFQHSLGVTGRYREPTADAHGTPGQRTAAFRNGFFMDLAEHENSVSNASVHFHANRLPRILTSGTKP